MRALIWRVTRVVLTLVVGGALMGATVQGLLSARERRASPHPGRLVAVGGFQLHLLCVGDGAPTVVLESPAGGVSTGWREVVDAVAPVTRVCSYDRAGLGWSEAGTLVFDPASVTDTLATLLAAAGERPPYVLAGFGLGADIAHRFARQYPEDVAGLLEVDPGDRRTPLERELAALGPRAAWLARFGALRASSRLTRHVPGSGDAAVTTRVFLNRPDHLTRAAQELAAFRNAEIAEAAPGPAGVHVPMTSPASVLTGADAAAVSDAIVRAVRRLRSGSLGS